MKNYIVLFVFFLFVSACSTSVKSPSDWKVAEGESFNKENFSLDQYAEQGYKCFTIAQKMHASNNVKKKDGYLGCMNTRGYQLTSMSESEIERRGYALEDYIKSRTPTEASFFDKEGFQDSVFVSDVRACRSEVNALKKTRTTAIYTPDPYQNLFNGFFTSFSDGAEYGKRKREREYALNCMLAKGYLLRELPELEKKRRSNLVK